MFNSSNGYSLADIAAATGSNKNNDGMFGGEGGWWIILLFLFAGWGGRGFGGYGNGFGAGAMGGVDVNFAQPWATPADIRAAVDQQTLISKLDQQTYGLADSTYALNSAITNGFHGVDTAICNLGYQNQAGFTALGTQIADCCCATQASIKDAVTQGVMNTNLLATQMANGFCDIEKANMQNRYDALTYNNNTLLAIDKLGDRIVDYLTQDKIASLTAENQSLKFAASQANQNAFITANQAAQTAEILDKLSPCPRPAYMVPNPNCCYNVPVLTSGCGCSSF